MMPSALNSVASELVQTAALARPTWCLEMLRGRLVEVQSDGQGASLSVVFDVLLEAQEAGEPVAWVTATSSVFCPADAALGGVDVSALVVVRVRNVVSGLRSAERLLRSGAFGVVVMDLGPTPQVPVGALGKLVKLAQHHDAVVMGVTGSRRGRVSLGPLVSLRVRTERARGADGLFSCSVDVLKDKRSGLGWSSSWDWSGPSGLR